MKKKRKFERIDQIEFGAKTFQYKPKPEWQV